MATVPGRQVAAIPCEGGRGRGSWPYAGVSYPAFASQARNAAAYMASTSSFHNIIIRIDHGNT